MLLLLLLFPVAVGEAHDLKETEMFGAPCAP